MTRGWSCVAHSPKARQSLMTAGPLHPATRRALVEGQGLFDARRFWEAHEVWESAWRVEKDDVRELLHGLIQVAAGCHHAVVTRRSHGTVKLLCSGLRKLEPLHAGMAGLDLDAFRQDVGRLLAAAEAWDRGASPVVDLELLPQLRHAGS